MQRRFWPIVRVLLVLLLLVATAITAFLAGFAVSAAVDASPYRSPQLTPILSPATTPAPTALPTVPAPATPDEEAFQLFWEVWDIIQRDYYGDLPDMQTVTYGAIRGVLETLGDEHTSFIEPGIAAILEEDASGAFEGIGAYVRMREDGKLEIASLFPGQPGEQAGLQQGDAILAVDGESIIGYDIYQAIALIRGPAGSEVTLLVERPEGKEPFEVTATRARITIPLVETEMLEGNVAYIRLTEFSATAGAQMEEELDGLLDREPVGLVLDLRGNPGGWLDQAVSVADLFLGDGVVLLERSSDGSEDVYRSQDGDLAEAIPLAVLVNRGTASASEIVAGAIQDRGRGVLVGERTFGKGSVQQPYRLSDGSELRVTIALWFTPDDLVIQGEGLAPDLVVPLLQENVEAGEDPQLDRAVEYLTVGE